MRPFLPASVLLCLTLSGCAAGDKTPPPPLPPLSPVMAFMAEARPGEITVLDDEAFGRQVRVTLEGGFTSADGEDCRRATVVARGRESEMVVICRSGDQPFTMAPRIWGQGIYN